MAEGLEKMIISLPSGFSADLFNEVDAIGPCGVLDTLFDHVGGELVL